MEPDQITEAFDIIRTELANPSAMNKTQELRVGMSALFILETVVKDIHAIAEDARFQKAVRSNVAIG